MKISETSQIRSKFPKISILVKIFEKFWLKSKFFKYLDVGQNFRKIAISVRIFENLDFGEDFRNTSILVKIVKNINFWKKFRKRAILVKIGEKFNLVKIFEKSLFYSKHLDCSPNTWKSRFWSKLPNNLDWSKKFSKYTDLDFGQWLEKWRFWSKSLKFSILIIIFEISQFR